MARLNKDFFGIEHRDHLYPHDAIFNPSPHVGSRFPRASAIARVDRLEDKPVHRLRITFFCIEGLIFPAKRVLIANGGFRRDHFGDPRDTFSRPDRPATDQDRRSGRRPKGVR